MRNAFADEIFHLAEKDERVVMLMADIGNRLFNDYRDQFPDRFYNCGVAEQNMISMAAGMASEGLRPFCYTITPFITSRCLEQIRVDVCYHRMPVTIVGTGSGLSYASLGATHHSCEDIATLRALPEMVVMAPGDALEVRGCMRLALGQKQPAYIRIGKKNEPVFHEEVPNIEVGLPIQMRKGEKVCLLSTGNMLPVAIEVGEMNGWEVFSCPSIKPFRENSLVELFRKFDVVATIEEHSVIGGFGGGVAEWYADRLENGFGALLRFGTADSFIHETTNQQSARDLFGLNSKAITERILNSL